MSHLPNARLHAYRNRSSDYRINIATTTDPDEFSNVEFRVNGLIEKEGLSAVAGGNGVLIDLTLPAAELDVTPGNYRWECVATINGEVKTIGQGRFFIGVEPTEEES